MVPETGTTDAGRSKTGRSQPEKDGHAKREKCKMAIPRLHDVTLPLLQRLANAGGELSHTDLVEQLAEHFKLTKAERELRHPKGRQKVFRNSRVGYAKLELKLAGFIFYSDGGPVRLTELGWKVLRDNPRRIDRDFLTPWQEHFKNQKESRQEFYAGLRDPAPLVTLSENLSEAKAWNENENYAIVREYFAMLESEQKGEPYNKTAHRQVLTETTGQSDNSIDFTFMNISAILLALGLPQIDGYKPLGNYRRALFEAVETHFEERPDLYAFLTGEVEIPPTRVGESNYEDSILFDNAPPPREPSEQSIPEEIEAFNRRLGHPAERDARNKNLGTAGEQLVFEYEKLRLLAIGQAELSHRVRWVARDDGDGCGYDILSFNGKGDEPDRELWLEVKTTNGSASTPFFITGNELRVSKERPDVYRIFRLYDFRKQARAFYLAPPLDKEVTLTPSVFRASF